MKNWIPVIFAVSVVLAGCSKQVQKNPEGEGSITEERVQTPAEPRQERKVEPRPERSAAAIVLDNVYFDYDQHALSSQARGVLAGHSRTLRENPGVRVRIEGHCDERGTIEYNLALGERRAVSVKRYLVDAGVDERRISTISYGKERPADPGHNEQAWALNRRAVFIVTP
ncbi:MAG: peptidoglycan-associated lipoprotein Pal [bacterium]|nr:peptidoglycan-associated lipoprotein Pal [bacterium]